MAKPSIVRSNSFEHQKFNRGGSEKTEDGIKKMNKFEMLLNFSILLFYAHFTYCGNRR